MPIELGSFSFGTVVGGIVCATAAHYLTKSRNIENRRIKEFNGAAAKFRTVFKDELLALNPALSHNSTDTAELLEAVFDKHRMAVFDFRPFLSSESIQGFDKAWQEYYRPRGAAARRPAQDLRAATLFCCAGISRTRRPHRHTAEADAREAEERGP